MRLDVTRLSYSVADRCLIDGVTFSSAPGACTALLGANGAGKSLLLRLCHGLIAPTAGTVRWGGQSPAAVAGRIAMVFQHPVLLSRSVSRNIEHALGLRALARSERKVRARRALELVGLADCANQKATTASGGQRQRIAIARAWALQPSVILMDEPTSGLDVQAAEMIEGLIRTFVADGVKVIFTSHNPAQVKRLGDEVLFLDQGRLICHAGKREFFSEVEDARVLRFIRSQSIQ